MSALMQNTKEESIDRMNDSERKESAKIIKMPDKEEDKMGEHKKNKEKHKINWQTMKPYIPYLASVVVTIFTVGVAWGTMHSDLHNLQEDVSSIKSDVEQLNVAVNGDASAGIPGLCSDVRSLGDRVQSLEDRVTRLESDRQITVLDGEGLLTIEDNNLSNLKAYNPEDELGTDATGRAYTAAELSGKQVILCYEINGQENYLLGSINKGYCWDGECIVNTYNGNGSFFGVTKYTIENGHILKYESFHKDTDGINTWTFADREITDDGKSGTSASYFLEYEKTENFTNKSITAGDILYVSDFLSIDEKKMLKYYSGLTVGGEFNDDTGTAYEIILNDDGTVKTLYVGRFEEGQFKDNSGDAWEIAYAEKYGIYVHNTGMFENNRAVQGSNKPLTQEEINNIVSDYEDKSNSKFGIPLHWKPIK